MSFESLKIEVICFGNVGSNGPIAHFQSNVRDESSFQTQKVLRKTDKQQT